jgi:drug/metabolite transporter (DMT)-like permease
MTSPSRILLISMSTVFAVCILGLLLGMLYSLYESVFFHEDLESILSRSIPYYKALGLLGILGMLLFFVFLFFQMAEKGGKKPR